MRISAIVSRLGLSYAAAHDQARTATKMVGAKLLDRPVGLSLLISSHIALSCVSLWLLAHFSYPDAIDPARFHILYNAGQLHVAIAVVVAFGLLIGLFLFAPFSFGYFAGFYLFTMVLGYLWLNCFSDLQYDHRAAGISASLSAVALLLPALLLTKPFPQLFSLSPRAFERLLHVIVLLSIVTIIVAASYDFRLINPSNMYEFRDSLRTPKWVNYLIWISCSALLPFAFAVFVLRGAYKRSATVLVLMLLFYPITLTKFALFAPIWLVFLTVLSRYLRMRTVVVVSLLGPMLAGILASLSLNNSTAAFFLTVNFRMIAIPSNALDIYSDFFSRHEVTRFCQISVVKSLMDCPYNEQLGVMMQRIHNFGNLNASLFATEGVASVGIAYAPFSVFLCGLVFAAGNRLSSHLPPRFVLLSASALPPVLLNVPLSTALLTHGAGILFLLWYLMPRKVLQHG